MKRHLKATAHNNAAQAQVSSRWRPLKHVKIKNPGRMWATYLCTSELLMWTATVPYWKQTSFVWRDYCCFFFLFIASKDILLTVEKAPVPIAVAWRDVIFSVSHGEHWRTRLAAAAARWSRRPITNQSDDQWNVREKAITAWPDKRWLGPESAARWRHKYEVREKFTVTN